MQKNRSLRRSFVLTLCVLFVASTLLISVLAAAHIGHHHLPDRQCTACLQISCAQSLLKQLGFLLALAGVTLAIYGVLCVFRLAAEGAQVGSLVSRKVRMNN